MMSSLSVLVVTEVISVLLAAVEAEVLTVWTPSVGSHQRIFAWIALAD
jgi:hypothetical protein